MRAGLGIRSAGCADHSSAIPGLSVARDGIGGNQDFAHDGGERDLAGAMILGDEPIVEVAEARGMPEVEIIPHPVFSRTAKPQDWRTSRGNMAILVGEYGKYLAALLLPFADRPALRDGDSIGAEARR